MQVSKKKALLSGKCPRCREGEMFPHKITHLTRFSEMNSHCPVCKLKFEVEPGFFIGAMYVSYAMTVAILIIVGIILFLFTDPTLLIFVSSVTGTIVILLPLIYRYSRILYLYWFGGIDFDGAYRN